MGGGRPPIRGWRAAVAVSGPVALVARRTTLWLVAGLALLTAACNVPPPESDWPEVTYRHLPPIRFDVAEVVVKRAYTPPLAKPNVDHLMPSPPVVLATRWAQDRLVADGRADRLEFTIVDASVVETELHSDTSLQDFFTVSQSERYDARLAVQVALIEDGGLRRATVEAEARRSVTVPEDASLRERERVWFKLGESLMTDLNAELEATLRRHMAADILN
jgi:hypothetical protein